MTDLGAVHRYHDGTKHHFHQFARSLGYLDWASQPRPFRSFHGARDLSLAPRPDAPPQTATIGHLLRHSLGLSAWKQFGSSRWSLRVNPSSGNLHPTEAYVIGRDDAATTAGDRVGVFHYAADRHSLEERCACSFEWPADACLVALTSIHWREAWKYGERAFRYCQHDLGHAIAALAYAAATIGWRARLLSDWSHDDIAAVTGVARDADFVDAEREEPACAIALFRGAAPEIDRAALVRAVQSATWSGRATQLSDDHVQWTFIDEIAEATRDAVRPAIVVPPIQPVPPVQPFPPSRLIQRRSAVAFDGRSSIDRATCSTMFSAVASAFAPGDALWWTPRVHLILFVHRVDDLEPGVYCLPRTAAIVARLKAAMRPDFLWEPAADDGLLRLARGDCRRLAQRLSCDQAIASDGFFSLGMLVDFDQSLHEFGASFYRHLYWECGAVGQALYLAAEAAGARATGIGCFYDDPVHDVLGLSGHAFQSLYHFTVGVPVEDTRLTVEPGYDWERRD